MCIVIEAKNHRGLDHDAHSQYFLNTSFGVFQAFQFRELMIVAFHHTFQANNIIIKYFFPYALSFSNYNSIGMFQCLIR